MLAKTLMDAAGGQLLTAEPATGHRRFCGYCLLASGLSVAMVPAALPEARTAWRALFGRR